ncbi:hypothetical protein [Nocardia sp. NPDC127526]|uniref:hypothetical protein n=1 Tax=Nocardia sp. NPDC127526 TaxID=3345393 RepID=UPI0036409929
MVVISMRATERGLLAAVAGLVFTGLTTHPGAVADPGGCTLIGTVGTPEVTVDHGAAGLTDLPLADIALPDRVYFRTSTETFNRRWSFAARNGNLYVKAAEAQGDWRSMALPACLGGRIAGVSADDDEVLAVDESGRFYTMDHALSAPRDWNWSSRYGTPLWTGPGNSLPPGTLDWTWSVLSPAEDHVWRDTAGNDHPVGGAKVSHVFALTDDGTRIRYIDPWLPVDHSYEMALPPRFRAIALSTSASTTLVVNRHGDLYTRLYDFDISGADKVFFRYSYADQRGLPEAPDMLSERIDNGTAAIQLPAPAWVRQPKVPGAITDRISIHKTGAGSDARELRVEGIDNGRTGYWTKDLTADQWAFVPTDQPLGGERIANTADDRSADPAVPLSPYDYAGRAAAGWSAAIENFDAAVTPTPLRLDFGDGLRLDLILHTVDGLRQAPQAPGLTAQPRRFDGAIEIPSYIMESLAAQPVPIREFLETTLGGRRFTDTGVVVTAGEFTIEGLGVTLGRVS